MHNATRMDQHLDMRQGQTEQPVGFDNLHSLVHQSGRVDSHLLTHLPGGMLQSLLRGYGGHLLQAIATEWPSGGSKNKPSHLLSVFTAQTLPDGTMFAVHTEDLY